MEEKRKKIMKQIDEIKNSIERLRREVRNREKNLESLHSLTEQCMQTIMRTKDKDMMVSQAYLMYLINNIMYCYSKIEKENWRIKISLKSLEVEEVEYKLRGNDISVIKHKRKMERDIHQKTIDGINKELNRQLDVMIAYCNRIGVYTVRKVN